MSKIENSRTMTDEDFEAQAMNLGILERGKLYELADDGLYQVWTAGGQTQRKKVLELTDVGDYLLVTLGY